MNIQDLKSNTTWQEASNTINNNNNKISLAIATLEKAKLKNKGYFTTLEKLNEAIPNPTIGSKAYVGTSEPYAIYIVENGAWVDSGYTGGDEIVANITTDRIEDGAVTTEKIATTAFDSTLSVSGKIAPADVVGAKFTELENKTSEITGHPISFAFTNEGGLGEDGLIVQGNKAYYSHTDRIPVKQGDVIYYKSFVNSPAIMNIVQFNGDVVVEYSHYLNVLKEESITMGDGVSHVVISTQNEHMDVSYAKKEFYNSLSDKIDSVIGKLYGNTDFSSLLPFYGSDGSLYTNGNRKSVLIPVKEGQRVQYKTRNTSSVMSVALLDENKICVVDKSIAGIASDVWQSGVVTIPSGISYVNVQSMNNDTEEFVYLVSTMEIINTLSDELSLVHDKVENINDKIGTKQTIPFVQNNKGLYIDGHIETNYNYSTLSVQLKKGQSVIAYVRVPSNAIASYATFVGGNVERIVGTGGSTEYKTYSIVADTDMEVVFCTSNGNIPLSYVILGYDTDTILARLDRMENRPIKQRTSKVLHGYPSFGITSLNHVLSTGEELAYLNNKYIDRFDFVSVFKCSGDCDISFGNKENDTYNVSVNIVGNTFKIVVFKKASDTYDGANKVVFTDTMPFSLTNGGKYGIEVKKYDEQTYQDTTRSGVEFIVTDSSNGTLYRKYIEKTNDTTQYDGVRTAILTLCWGKPYVKVNSGSITITDIFISSDYNPSAKMIAFGDSYTEGDTMIAYGLNNRYLSKVRNAVGDNDVVLYGKGGQDISLEWMKGAKEMVLSFVPDYVYIALGCNNKTIDAIYLLREFILFLEALGVKPVLSTTIPYPSGTNPDSRHDFRVAYNNFVRSSGHRYVDIGRILTTDDDGAVINTNLVLGDQIHPNVAGHQKIYEWIQHNLPEMVMM